MKDAPQTAFVISLGIAFACLALTNAHSQEQAGTAGGTTSIEERISNLEQEVSDLEDVYAGVGFLMGIVCALWAQNTKRNAWVWFFFGLFLFPIAGLVMLAKNYRANQGLPQSESLRSLLLVGLLLAAMVIVFIAALTWTA